MQRRIAVWAGLGVVAACCWLLYVVLTPPERASVALNLPAVRALGYISCPITLAGDHFNFPLPFWMVGVANAATYALIGLLVETLRSRFVPSPETKHPVA